MEHINTFGNASFLFTVRSKARKFPDEGQERRRAYPSKALTAGNTLSEVSSKSGYRGSPKAESHHTGPKLPGASGTSIGSNPVTSCSATSAGAAEFPRLPHGHLSSLFHLRRLSYRHIQYILCTPPHQYLTVDPGVHPIIARSATSVVSLVPAVALPPLLRS
ncbi:hypothetical protein HPB50_003175 [Hyalomma asiaticum]|uniref:Uncharacterized protein n=1 Tax=Hyalomma asiaticum TaxID=266040 RepID=A0ACB7RTY2_HYAAI|nr:hypothetical protein HPB50_003175 [Hyalomma asiaticum]